jgi:hypothetical protein
MAAMPFMIGADALLYFGGRATRLRRSRAGVIFGCVSVVLGMLLWIGTVLMQVWLVAYLMEI